MILLQCKLNRSFLFSGPSNGFMPHLKLKARHFQWPLKPHISVPSHHSFSHHLPDVMFYFLFLFSIYQSPSSHWLFLTLSRDTSSPGSLHSLFPLLVVMLFKLSAWLILSPLLVLSSDITFLMKIFLVTPVEQAIPHTLTSINISVFSALLLWFFFFSLSFI